LYAAIRKPNDQSILVRLGKGLKDTLHTEFVVGNIKFKVFLRRDGNWGYRCDIYAHNFSEYIKHVELCGSRLNRILRRIRQMICKIAGVREL